VRLASTAMRIGASSLAMGVAAVLVGRVMEIFVPGSAIWFQAARLAVAMSGALLTLALTASVLGLSEFDDTLEEVRKRLRQAWLGQGPSTTDVSST